MAASILEDLEVGEAIAADIIGYMNGQNVTADPTLPGLGKVSITTALLPNGPQPGQLTFSTNILADITTGVVATSEWVAGQAVTVAAKVGAAWHAITFAPYVAPAAAPAAT